MLKLLSSFWNDIVCKHEFEFVENIYGDAIIHVGGDRSWWQCKKCGNWTTKPELKN